MLSHADEQVVARDRGLPGLALLLDDQALGRWLSRELTDDVVVRTGYLRYKPGTSCVVGVDVCVGGAEAKPWMVAAHAPRAAAKTRKTRQRARRGLPVVHDVGRVVVAAPYEADRDLPALRALAGARRRGRLLGPLVAEAATASVRTLAYKPQRRWVGLLGGPTGERFVLRAHRPVALNRSVEPLRRLGRHARAPRLVGTVEQLGLAVVEHVEGRTLTTTSRGDDLAAAGRELARLHGRDIGGLRTLPLARGDEAVLTSSRQVAVLLPELAEEVTSVAEGVARLVAVGATPSTTVHGDFSLDQVVVTSGGEARLIDLDRAGFGEPAYDLACAAAECASSGGRVLDALLDGYAELAELPERGRMATFEAAHLLRRAADPFRHRTPDWPVHTERLVQLARARLELARAEVRT